MLTTYVCPRHGFWDGIAPFQVQYSATASLFDLARVVRDAAKVMTKAEIVDSPWICALDLDSKYLIQFTSSTPPVVHLDHPRSVIGAIKFCKPWDVSGNH